MFGYLDSIGFQIAFLSFLIILSILVLIFSQFKEKSNKLARLKPYIQIAIVSSCTILVLDSIPYLYLDIFDIPISNVILSNLYFALIAISIILYELSKYDFPERPKKGK